MPSYKLTYFNGRGRAEVSRYMFKLKDVDFEDIRIEDNWKEFQPTTPFGQVPLLEVDGFVFCQSAAIERLIAKRLGLYGKDDIEQIKSDMVVGCGEDVFKAIRKASSAPDDKKVEMKKKFVDKELSVMFPNLEKMMNSDGFFINNDLMWADIAIAHLLSLFEAWKFDVDLKKYPKLYSLKERFENHPKISAWIKVRPQSTF